MCQVTNRFICEELVISFESLRFTKVFLRGLLLLQHFKTGKNEYLLNLIIHYILS